MSIHCQIHNFVKIFFKELPKFALCNSWLCCILEVNCLNPEAKLFESGGNYHLKDSVIMPQSHIYFLILTNSPTSTTSSTMEGMLSSWANNLADIYDIWNKVLKWYCPKFLSNSMFISTFNLTNTTSYLWIACTIRSTARLQIVWTLRWFSKSCRADKCGKSSWLHEQERLHFLKHTILLG